MEALTALALVCNILQLIEQGSKLVTDCREFSKHGSSQEIKTLEDLDKLSTNASAIWQQAAEASPSTAIDRDIEKCARTCTTAVTELHKTLLDIRYKDGAGVERSALSKALKARRSLAKIKEQKDAFSDVQLLLQTTLLTAIREDIQRNTDAETKHLISMDKHIQDVLNAARMDGMTARNALQAISGIQAQLNDLSIEVKQQTRTVVDKLSSLKLDDYKREAVARLVEGLEFDGMYERENEVKARVNQYRETAKWIFGDFAASKDSLGDVDKSLTDVYAKFETWLRNGTGIWFMEGKPGSGKSSLMRYIRDNLKEEGKAHHLLSEWSQGAQCNVLSFFFFRPAASRLAKSYEGLWRSLCLQMLENDINLPGLVINDPNAPRSFKKALSADQTVSKTWQTDELKPWFFYLLSATKSYVLILLDGLDEFKEFEGGDEGHNFLLETIQTIDRKNSNVKLICSARPDEPFKSALEKGPYIKLQDVNYSDIASFTNSTLKDTKASGFATRIVERADGVFLWAHIVAHDLAKAARGNASLSQLEARLEHCPKEMHDLFRHLIARQDDFYRKNPQPILWLFHLSQQINQPYVRSPSISLFELLLLAYSDYSLENLFQILQEDFSPSLIIELTERAQGFGDEVVERCGGLLTIVDAKSDNHRDEVGILLGRKSSMHPRLWSLFEQEIRFVHRTAQDFLREDGASFLAASQISDSKSLLLLAGASIGILGLGGRFFIENSADAINYGISPLFGDYIDRALTDADYTGECRKALELLLELLAKPVPLNQSKSAITQLPLIATRDCYPACCDLPLKLRLLISIAGAHGSIVDSFVLPIVERLDDQLRPLAAAFTMVRSHFLSDAFKHSIGAPMHRWQDLLHMSTPFTELPLRYSISSDTTQYYLCQRPLWHHFFTYGFFKLAFDPERRSQGWEIADQYFDFGVSRKEICARCLLFKDEYIEDELEFQPYFYDWNSKLPGPEIQDGSEWDGWMIEQTVEDLPRGTTWRMTGKVTRYRPKGTGVWLTVSDTAAKDFVFDAMEHLDRQGHQFWQLSSRSKVLQASVNVVNHHLNRDPGKLRELLSGWGFSEGRVCHHFDADECKHCRFDKSPAFGSSLDSRE